GAANLWPERILKLGWTGRQSTGSGNVFEFIPVPAGEAIELAKDYNPTRATPTYDIQSLSLSLASKNLGREDEAWLLQVAVNLKVIEAHFAVGPQRQLPSAELNHLQMDLKLRKVQIDAMYLLTRALPGGRHDTVLVTVEAKQAGQRILEEQVVRQVK